ncbi:hypothetical protein BJV82DRAFT_662575 [Fennellomyces sp. T-0311]|nr:hypothetical protein BJV82DRAFT_662575 [Fennellomyces sp. T-0311]
MKSTRIHSKRVQYYFTNRSSRSNCADPPPATESHAERSTPEQNVILDSDSETEETSQSDDNSSVDSSSEESEQEEGANSQCTQEVIVRDRQRVELGAATKKEAGEFRKQARRLGYLQNSFPSSDEVTSGSAECVLYIRDKPYDKDARYKVEHATRKIYRKAVSDSRSALVTSMNDFLRDYEFDVDILLRRGVPSQRCLRQYHWLLNGTRFAREGFKDDGALMENPSLGHCIHYVFYNKQSSRKRLNYQEHDVTRPLLVLTYTLMCFCLASAYGHKTVSCKDNRWFSGKSQWKTNYEGMLHGPESRAVNWEKALKVQQNVIDMLEKSNSKSNFSLADLLSVQPDSEDEL